MDRSELLGKLRCLATLLQQLNAQTAAAAVVEAVHQLDDRPPPAEQASGELLADLDLVWHSVSDDRETNAAYERLKAALSQRPVVGEAMVERALSEFNDWTSATGEEREDTQRRLAMRHALTAALAPRQQGGDS